MVKLSASIEVLISSSLFPINQGKEILPVCHLAMRTITSSPPVSFHIHKATPTTVSYKVSTRRHTNSCTGKTLHYAGVALRLMLASYCVLVCWMLWQKKLDPDASITFNRFVASSIILKSACAPVHELPIQYMLVILVICFWSVVRRGYKEETLLVLRGLGVQTSTSASTYISTASTRFIPASQIQDIWIHEAFTGFEVRFYLAIIVKGEHDVVVVFPELLPSRLILEEVWRGAKACLHGSKA